MKFFSGVVGVCAIILVHTSFSEGGSPFYFGPGPSWEMIKSWWKPVGEAHFSTPDMKIWYGATPE